MGGGPARGAWFLRSDLRRCGAGLGVVGGGSFAAVEALGLARPVARGVTVFVIGRRCVRVGASIPRVVLGGFWLPPRGRAPGRATGGGPYARAAGGGRAKEEARDPEVAIDPPAGETV